MKKNILYYICLAGVIVMAASGKWFQFSCICDELFFLNSNSESYRSSSSGQEIDSSYDSSSDDVMDLDKGIENLEDLDVLELEPSSDENNRYLRVSSSNSGQLRAPRKPNLRRMPRQAPRGWKQAKRSSRHYHGFYLHTYCDCAFGDWFCFCLD